MYFPNAPRMYFLQIKCILIIHLVTSVESVGGVPGLRSGGITMIYLVIEMVLTASLSLSSQPDTIVI